MKLLGKVLEDRRVSDLALERSRLIHQLVATKALFARNLPFSVAASSFQEMRGGRDAVTSPEQALPLRVSLEDGRYQELLGRLRAWVREPLQQFTLLGELYETFLGLEVRVERFVADHEVFRCLLYMASPAADGDRYALEHARSMQTAVPEARRELLYIEVWALRRLKRFAEAASAVEAAVAEFPHDPRFVHGRALNNFSWRESSSTPALIPLVRIRRDLELTIKMYLKISPRDREMLAALYNDVAYVLTLDRRRTAAAAREARAALNNLKKWKERDEWRPGFPEYHHTEAAVEYLEFEVGLRQGTSKALLRQKLTFAYSALSSALNVMRKPPYEELHSRIVKALEELDRGAPI